MSQFCRRHGCPNDAVPSQDYCDIHLSMPYAPTKSLPTAGSILQTAAKHMEDRAVTYDLPQGERSMHRTVAMFNTLTDHLLTDEQGWLFMTCLKMVRAQAGGYRADSYEDGAAYFALAGESAAQERV